MTTLSAHRVHALGIALTMSRYQAGETCSPPSDCGIR